MDNPAVVTETAAVRIERTLPGPIERVWDYLTDSRKRATWLAAGEFDLRVGGKTELHFDHAELSAEKTTPERYRNEQNARIIGHITRWEPPRVLSYTWDWVHEKSEVTFELEARGNEVLLTLTHRRLGDRAAMVSVASGWDAHLGILADRLNGVEPRPFWTTHAALEREYEARL
jgi:uncharacterized protein YndB with AHSA1/START domain